MPQVNHLRRWVDHSRVISVRRPQAGDAFAVNSFLGAVDPAFDAISETEIEIAERLRDRGKF
jgi:hypothetical protein